MAIRHATSTEEHQNDGKTPLNVSGGKPTVQVKVYSPFKSYFDEEAYSVSCVNATGPFDILPHHHNFISLLVPCDIIIRTVDGQKKVRISGGIIHVKTDHITVFLDV